jgi:hypothetical protein
LRFAIRRKGLRQRPRERTDDGPRPEARSLQCLRRVGAAVQAELEITVDVQEVRKLDAYLKRVFGNQKIRVVPRPKKEDSAEVYIGEEFIGVLFVDDEDDDRSFQFQMAILEDDLVDVE